MTLNNISCLPTDGIPGDIQTLISDNATTSEQQTEGATTLDDALHQLEGEDEISNVSTSFMPRPQNIQREDAIRSTIGGHDSLDWPSHWTGHH